MFGKDYELEKRKYVLGGLIFLVIFMYICRLMSLQIFSDYADQADNNALLKRIKFPARGSMYDRKGTLIVYDEPSYDIMVVMQEQHGVDTLALCRCLGVTRDWYIRRMDEIKDPTRNPNYSRYTQQLFVSQISPEEFSSFDEKKFMFPGFYVQKRSVRRYRTTCGAHVLGDVGEASETEVANDPYYRNGDYIGKTGVERSYETQLRGRKGQEVLLRDVRGRLKGTYLNGALDTLPVPGKDLTLSIDIKLQELGEKLMRGKNGAIVAIEPSTGEVLCLVSSPTYNPNTLVGKMRGKNSAYLQKNPMKPLLNRAIMGQYPPGSTFKTGQALTFMQEGIIGSQSTAYPCQRGFHFKGMKVGCHSHPAPLTLVPAIATSCNGYFCWGLYYMLNDRQRYPTIEDAITCWKDYMVSMGFGYKLGIDLPGEKRGMIPNAQFYDHAFGEWNPLSVISISIGQGEVTLTPLQIANLGATIANRGYYIRPHVVKNITGEAIDTFYTNRHYTKVDTRYYNEVVAGMRQAVISGTCKSANTSRYEVCGKTGTAQNRGHDHSVFMGFAPRENPKIAVAVYVENGGFGATFGVPIGALMMEQFIEDSLTESSRAHANSIASQSINYSEPAPKVKKATPTPNGNKQTNKNRSIIDQRSSTSRSF